MAKTLEQNLQELIGSLVFQLAAANTNLAQVSEQLQLVQAELDTFKTRSE